MNEFDASPGEPASPLSDRLFADPGNERLSRVNDELCPMSLGEILDRAVQMYRSHFLVFVGIAHPPAASLGEVAAGTPGGPA